jgi:hypothetical protein
MYRDGGTNLSFSPDDFSAIGKYTSLSTFLTQNTVLFVFASISPVLETLA